MPFAQHPPENQPPTFIPLAELVAASQGFVRLQELNPETLPADLDLTMVGFVLATRNQVEMLGFMEEWNIGLAVSCTGQNTNPFHYRRYESSHDIFEKTNVPVAWVTGRWIWLNIAMPYVVSAFARRQCVLLHCNQSFHRAPVGLAMFARLLFGCEPSDVMHFPSLAKSSVAGICGSICSGRRNCRSGSRGPRVRCSPPHGGIGRRARLRVQGKARLGAQGKPWLRAKGRARLGAQGRARLRAKGRRRRGASRPFLTSKKNTSIGL